MINLLCFRERALYPSDHAFRGEALAGAEAYAACGRAAAAPFKRAGGSQIWLDAPELVVIGPAEEARHLAFVASYPTGGAFLAMRRDPEYRQAVVHRTAALADSRLIRCASGPAVRTLGAPPEAGGPPALNTTIQNRLRGGGAGPDQLEIAEDAFAQPARQRCRWSSTSATICAWVKPVMSRWRGVSSEPAESRHSRARRCSGASRAVMAGRGRPRALSL